MKWKPIKTVPKDGRMVDLYHTDACRIPDCYYEDECWESYYTDYIQNVSQEGFTHWMPCPDNPE